MSYRDQPLHIKADADYHAHELLNPEVYAIPNVQESIAAINDLDYAKLMIEYLVTEHPIKPREHYNWCDLSDDEKGETSRWVCGSCDFPLSESHNYCPNCGTKITWS